MRRVKPAAHRRKFPCTSWLSDCRSGNRKTSQYRKNRYMLAIMGVTI